VRCLANEHKSGLRDAAGSGVRHVYPTSLSDSACTVRVLAPVAA